jgi:phosphatidate cytidylyltransferase
MAFNIQTFRTRTLTAIIFVAVMLTGLLWNQWSFLVLFSIIHFGCWWEYLKLTEKIHSTSFHSYTKIGLMVMGYGIMLWFCSPSFQISGYGLKENISLPVSAAGFALLLTGIFQKNPINVKAFGFAVSGLLYISLCWGLMMDLYGIETRNPVLYKDSNLYLLYFPLLVIGCMWINDTMAYIVGSLIGKTPLSKISPKKTWEGTIGGIVLCSVFAGYLGFMFDDWFIFWKPLKCWIILAAIAAITGTIGDLLESKLKRMADVKDSGSLMPGHGGFLDRFDSLLLATPFVWLYVHLFMK